jgi:hypothetical protein
MKTRTIVVLVVAGAVLMLAGLGRGGRGSGTPSSSPPPAAGAEATTTSDPATDAAETPGDATPTTSSVSTISPAELEHLLEGVDELEQTQPLVRHLPHDSVHFNVDYLVVGEAELVLEVELRVILNRPEQLATYEADLRAYKAEALEWLRSVGADPAAYAIEWRPAEAATL